MQSGVFGGDSQALAEDRLALGVASLLPQDVGQLDPGDGQLGGDGEGPADGRLGAGGIAHSPV